MPRYFPEPIGDPRVSPRLTHCLECGHPLAIHTVAVREFMVLFGRCFPCNRLYVLDEMTAPQEE